MVRIDLSYHVSERGRREAIKVGHAHQAIHYYTLRPEEPFHADFAEFVDLDKVYEDPETREDFVDYQVGAPYGFFVDDCFDHYEIKELENPETLKFFDSPMELWSLLEFEIQHRAARESALNSAKEELAQVQEAEEKRMWKYHEERSLEAVKWMEDHAHWASLPAVQRLKKEIENKKSKGVILLDQDLIKKAQEAVAFAEDLQEASAWVKSSGSKRLTQILKEGLLGSSMTLYRDERLSKEHTNWEWVKKPYPSHRLEDPRNPSELLLDCVDKARLDFSDAKLRWDKEQKETIILATFMKRQVRYKVPTTFPDDDIPF